MSYTTKQRKLISELLKSSKNRHMTADEIYAALKNAGESVGKATIYRYLDVLFEAKQVRRYTAEDGASACYQYIDEEACFEHFHLKCGGCGKLFHVECDLLSNLGNHIRSNHGFNIDNAKTVFHGRCSHCELKEAVV